MKKTLSIIAGIILGIWIAQHCSNPKVKGHKVTCHADSVIVMQEGGTK